LKKPTIHTAGSITLFWGILVGSWVIVSDRLLAFWVSDPNSLNTLQTVKGLLATVVASILLHKLLRHEQTLREHIGNTLRNSEVPFRTIVENAPIPLVITRVDSEILYCNEAYANTLNLPREALLGCRSETYYANAKTRQTFLERLYQEGTVAGMELQGARPDGSRFWSVATSRLLMSGGEPAILTVFQDITERKQAEEALHESEERYRTLIEQASDGIFITDSEGNYLDVNTSGCEMLGYTRAEILRLGIRQIVPPEGQAALTQRIEGLLSGETVLSEHQLRRKDGVLVPVETSGKMLSDGRFVGIVRDITKRKQTEESLRDSEERLRLILDQLPIMLWTTDTNLVATSSRGAGLAQLGLESDQIVGVSLEEFVGNNDPTHPAIVAHHAALRGTSSHYLDTVAGQEYDVTVGPLRDGDGTIRGVIGVSFDITERKKVEEELKKRRELLQTIVDNVPVMLVFMSADGKTEWVNREWERVLGWSLEEARTQDILSRMYPDPVHRQEVLDFALEVTAEWRDFRTTAKDGHVIDTAWANVRLSDGRGIGIAQDITERKRIQEQLHRYTTRLEILRDLDRAILSAQSLQNIAAAALTHLRQLVPSTRMSVTTHDFQANTAHILVAQAERETQLKTGEQIPLDTFVEIEALQRGRYQLVVDIRALTTRRLVDQQLLSEGVRSYINIPLVFQDELIGSLNLGAEHPDAFSTERIEITQEVADLLAIALQQARLHEHVQRYAAELEQRVNERTVELAQANARLIQVIHAHEQAEAAEREQRTLAEALRDIATVLNSALDLEEVFERILASVGRVVPHDYANIMLIEDGNARVVRGKGYENEAVEEILLAARFEVDSVANMRKMVETGQPMVIADTGAYPGWVQVPGLPQPISYAGTPIRRGKQTIGFLNLESTKSGFFTETHAQRLGGFADQAAVAIQNAQSFLQVQQLAALEERQRLARDLHDAVSQTLWSASLVADLLPTVWEQDTVKGREQLRRLSQLTHGALAEMRLLLLELRPAALAQMKIEDLLRQLTEATISRTQIDISLEVEGQCKLTSAIQVALYRIAQEALNNATRHAMATRIDVRLHCTAEQGELMVSDNGHGFDPANVPAGHLGLAIMRERAAAIGAGLEIASQPNQGTRVSIVWLRSTRGNSE
jgi:PAS domain S-box-containing protein